MIFHFTCACGNALEVEAPSHTLAMTAALDAGWRALPMSCTQCLEEEDAEPRGTRETRNQEVP